jgi:hypothetical protein
MDPDAFAHFMTVPRGATNSRARRSSESSGSDARRDGDSIALADVDLAAAKARYFAAKTGPG